MRFRNVFFEISEKCVSICLSISGCGERGGLAGVSGKFKPKMGSKFSIMEFDHALLECSCFVRFSISCTACWELFVWAICFLIFV